MWIVYEKSWKRVSVFHTTMLKLDFLLSTPPFQSHHHQLHEDAVPDVEKAKPFHQTADHACFSVSAQSRQSAAAGGKGILCLQLSSRRHRQVLNLIIIFSCECVQLSWLSRVMWPDDKTSGYWGKIRPPWQKVCVACEKPFLPEQVCFCSRSSTNRVCGHTSVRKWMCVYHTQAIVKLLCFHLRLWANALLSKRFEPRWHLFPPFYF